MTPQIALSSSNFPPGIQRPEQRILLSVRFCVNRVVTPVAVHCVVVQVVHSLALANRLTEGPSHGLLLAVILRGDSGTGWSLEWGDSADRSYLAARRSEKYEFQGKNFIGTLHKGLHVAKGGSV